MNNWSSPPEDQARLERRRARARALVRRSMLFVPANVPRFIERAHERGADALILDLEDSVPADEKAAARAALPDAVPRVGRGGADVLVRVNKPFAAIVRDLDAAVAARATGIWFPKAEEAEELAVLDALLLERELAAGLPPGSVDVSVAIESARAFFNLPEIVARSARIERIVGISFGAEDVTAELGIETSPEGWERFLGNATTVLSAAAAGVAAFGRLGSMFDFKDLADYEASIARSVRFGFVGSTCIHPAQVPLNNRGFSPSPQRLAHARAVVEAMAAAVAAGRASTSVEGKMVDIPSLQRAERLLERAAAIEGKDAQKASGRA